VSSQYIILKYKTVYSGEFAQIAVFSYDTDEDKPAVYLSFIEGWARVNSTAESTSDPVFEDLLGTFLRKIDTKVLLQEFIGNSGTLYSVFMLMPPNDSSSPAETLAEEIASTLLVE